jgi:predicted AAA+ superfamily ATPase
VDTGLINLYPNTVSNLSNQLENIVFLNLRKQPNPIYFGSLASGKEIDFIQQTEDGSFGKYQVSQTLHPDNYHRELSPFMLKGTYLEKGSNILLTLDEDEEDIEFKKYSISKKNLLRWLLKL